LSGRLAPADGWPLGEEGAELRRGRLRLATARALESARPLEPLEEEGGEPGAEQRALHRVPLVHRVELAKQVRLQRALLAEGEEAERNLLDGSAGLCKLSRGERVGAARELVLCVLREHQVALRRHARRAVGERRLEVARLEVQPPHVALLAVDRDAERAALAPRPQPALRRLPHEAEQRAAGGGRTSDAHQLAREAGEGRYAATVQDEQVQICEGEGERRPAQRGRRGGAGTRALRQVGGRRVWPDLLLATPPAL